MMRGGSRPRRETLFPPKGIVVRGSSDEFVIHDRLVAHAARFIRENATAGINVDDLCRKLNASRSTLDRRMKTALSRTPKEEILRVRFREVERLLRETDLTIEAVAANVGYRQPSYFIKHFRRDHTVTPAIWRRHTRASNQPVQA